MIPNVTHHSLTDRYATTIQEIRRGPNFIIYLTYIDSLRANGMLLIADMDSLRPKVIVKLAFMLGSSKQGKARRASGASI